MKGAKKVGAMCMLCTCHDTGGNDGPMVPMIRVRISNNYYAGERHPRMYIKIPLEWMECCVPLRVDLEGKSLVVYYVSSVCSVVLLSDGIFVTTQYCNIVAIPDDPELALSTECWLGGVVVAWTLDLST